MTYSLTNHFMVDLEKIFALTSMKYVVDLNAYELNPKGDKKIQYGPKP